LDDHQIVEEPKMMNDRRTRFPRLILRTQSNAVIVPALVKDRAGKLVFGLQAKDFIVEDDGIEQQVRMDEAEPQEAVSLVVAIRPENYVVVARRSYWVEDRDSAHE
jgi:hypothetical protein